MDHKTKTEEINTEANYFKDKYLSKLIRATSTPTNSIQDEVPPNSPITVKSTHDELNKAETDVVKLSIATHANVTTQTKDATNKKDAGEVPSEEEKLDNVNEAKKKEIERRESRISEKLAEAVHAYQEALERKIRDAAKKESKDHNSDDDDSSDRGLALWKRAKVSLMTKMAKTKQRAAVKENKEEEPRQKVRFQKWKRTANIQPKQPGYAARRRSITEMQNTMRKKLILQRFRRIARLVIFCRRCVQDHCFK